LSEDILSEEYWTPRIVLESLDREVSNIAAKILRRLNDIRSMRKILEQRSERPLIKKTRDYNKNYCVLAIDTSFTSPPIELVGGRLGIINRAIVLFGDCPNSCVDLSSYVKFVEGEEYYIRFYSKILERAAIKKMLLDKKHGRTDFDVIIIDGELIPRLPPGYKGSEEKLSYRLLAKIIKLTRDILKLAEETNTSIVGVIKRAYGIDLTVTLGLKRKIFDKDYYEKTINDKVVATYMLETGEWIEICTYRELYGLLKENAEKISDIRRLREKMRFLEKLDENIPEVLDTIIAVYKASTPTYFSIATKIEAYPINYTIDEIISYLVKTTTVNGVPLPIDIVDRMASIKKGQEFVAQQQFYSHLTRLLKDEKLAKSIAGLTNPEKMKSVGFK